jgi:hypothetical protein
MNLMLKLFTFIFLLISTSCDSTRTAVEQTEPTVNNTKEMDTKYANDGYASGVIDYDEKRSKCSFIIIDDKSKLKYDPININEDKFASLRGNGTKIYFKFHALRMMNRCDDAQPIEIEDIKKREN